MRLEQNYRSTQNILEAAGAVVSNNIRRKGKKLWTDRQGGSLIGYYEAPDGENEALFIADRVQKFLREAGESGEEPHCAVLYRTNSQSRLVEEALRRYGVKYSMVGGFSFYERAEIKDLLSYLRLVQNPHDSMALNRVDQHAAARHRSSNPGHHRAAGTGNRLVKLGRDGGGNQ